MLRRLLVGLIKGLLIGGVVALLLIKGLSLLAFGAWLAYPLAVLVGMLTGLIAGRPIWAQGARIEAYLKAGVGALLGAGLMFALRQWLTVPVPPLPLELGGGAGALLGDVPIVALPLISTVLALLYDLDNTGDEEVDAPPKKQRVLGGEKVRVEGESIDEDILAEIEDDLARHAEKEEH